MIKLLILAEVLCPKINKYGSIDHCASCPHFVDLEEGIKILCDYEVPFKYLCKGEPNDI